MPVQLTGEPNRGMRTMSDAYAERFWRKVLRGDRCWIWQGPPDAYGYGRFFRCGKMVKATRVAWELTNGEIPAGLCVLHNCDASYPPGDTSYRMCVRPDHLFLGTRQENTADMVAKGRQARGDRHHMRKYPEQRVRGEAHWTHQHPEYAARGDQNGVRKHPERFWCSDSKPSSKLTADQVREIRARYAAGGVRQRDLAKEYRVSQSTISAIIAGRQWKYLTTRAG